MANRKTGLDVFDDLAEAAFTSLTKEGLAKIFRDAQGIIKAKEDEHLLRVRIVSCLLDLLGGQAVIPGHVLRNAVGYQTFPGNRAGDITIVINGFHDRFSGAQAARG